MRLRLPSLRSVVSFLVVYGLALALTTIYHNIGQKGRLAVVAGLWIVMVGTLHYTHHEIKKSREARRRAIRNP